MSSIVHISLQELSLATNNFAKETAIANGGFGKVYKGESEKHGIIALKRLDRGQGQGDHEFKTEITLLSEYKHKNIVSLIGYCDEDGEKILVYRYESKGSLNKHLKSKDLTWIQRLQICLDAARGLKYLHDDVGPQKRVLHRDVKSANILLDENWNAKISDFGLSRIGPADKRSTFLFSNACGTVGYIDPEYLITGYLSKESDVYSFGVVLFEVLCGRPAVVTAYKDERQFLTVLVEKHYRRRSLNEIVLSDIRDQIDAASLLTFSTVAYQCLKNGKGERPTMKKVVEKLEKALNSQQESSASLYFDVYDDFSQEDDDNFAALNQGQSGSLESSSQSIIPASSSKWWNHDVYISYGQNDTRYSFADHLYLALVRREIHTLLSENPLFRAEEISPASSKAIKESRIAIVIFSPSYAHSSWCLDELALLMKNRDERGQIVMPIYFHVKPSQVRDQTHEYAEAFAWHELKNSKKVKSWREALVDAANLPTGWDMDYRHESEVFREIVEIISYRLLSLMPSAEESRGTSANADLIGIETRMEDFKPLLKVGSGGVRMVGIYGMWGSGKSTLASSIYDEISHEFEGCCFVNNIRAESRMHGLKTLQEKILSKVLKSKVTLKSIKQGIYMMDRRLRRNSFLIVLDDVDHIDQLKMLAGSLNWFGEGSRIIITTRNQDLLTAHNVNITRQVRMLDVKESIELFRKRAFGSAGRPKKISVKVTRNMVSKFGGHPSALISLGSFLHGKDMSEWMSILARLEGIPVDEILKKFKSGDDGIKLMFSELRPLEQRRGNEDKRLFSFFCSCW